MKKIYFAPTTDVTTIELQQMMASSPGQKELDPESEPIENGDDIGSRRRSVWDDED